jgi:hypothetical protein
MYGYERIVAQVYRDNIAVSLPLTILTIKIFVRIVTREKPKDIFRSVLVIPLDLVYIAFGLLLAGMAGRIPSFTAHYGNRANAIGPGLVLGCSLFIVACLVTLMDRAVRLIWQKFFAASTLARQIPQDGKQMSLLEQASTRQVAVVYLWMFVYWALMISLIFTQAVIAVVSLSEILKRIQ